MWINRWRLPTVHLFETIPSTSIQSTFLNIDITPAPKPETTHSIICTYICLNWLTWTWLEAILPDGPIHRLTLHGTLSSSVNAGRGAYSIEVRRRATQNRLIAVQTSTGDFKSLVV